MLTAVDSDGTIDTETLQLKADGGLFTVSVTNREYFVTVKLPIDADIKFNATVMAVKFLKLVSQITTDTIDLSVDGASLVIKGNGVYRLPMIYDDDILLELNKIVINNKTVEMRVHGSTLISVLQNNSKELLKVKELTTMRPFQRYYYLDEEGAITTTTGACVNNFKLEKPIKVLLNSNIVKLFSLFSDDDVVNLSLGHDAIDNGTIQTKIGFETETVSIVSIILCDEAMVRLMPARQLRARANAQHNHSVCFNKAELLKAINRFILMYSDNNSLNRFCGSLEFSNTSMQIGSYGCDFVEKIPYVTDVTTLDTPYTCMLNLNDLKLCLDSHTSNTVTINFGDHQAIVVSRGRVQNLIPEVDDV